MNCLGLRDLRSVRYLALLLKYSHAQEVEAFVERRGEPCTLLVFIHDVTSWLMHLRCRAIKSAEGYSRRLKATSSPTL
jgi:hypothetical protein